MPNEPVYFREVYEYPIKEFTAHLGNAENQRILFSGKYGSGKTSFLKEFFKDSDKYVVYHLFPINYSIASNEDIIRYIKYDIILEMVRHQEDFPEKSKTYLKTLPAYLMKRADKALAAIIGMIPEVGKTVLEMYDRIEKLKDEYLSFHDEENKGTGDWFDGYLDEIETKSGGIFENDLITQLIVKINEGKAPMESVLIVDDLDRLDPEHVFRILNVFAAHFDVSPGNGAKNKFAFDKVIVVCDVQNIRNVFHHRYGRDTDFIGYMDKFYSSEIYRFDNRKAVGSIINSLFESYVFARGDITQYDLYFGDGFLQEILEIFVARGIISLRTLLKTYGWSIYHPQKILLNKLSGFIINSFRPFGCHQLKLLRDILGDYRTTINILEGCEESNMPFSLYEHFSGIFLFIAHMNRENYTTTAPFPIQFNKERIIAVAEYKASQAQLSGLRLFEEKGFAIGHDLDQKTEFVFGYTFFWRTIIAAFKRLHLAGFID